MNARPFIALGICAAVIFGTASATTVTYVPTDLGGSRWRYDYTITNDSLGTPLDEFTIFFAVGDFANLAVVEAPPGWDPLVVQPDADLPDDGFFDALALDAGLAPGATLAGFAVSVDYLGAGTPGAQAFDVVDPATFATIDSGTTSPVPLPGGAWLAGAAALAGASRARRRRARPALTMAAVLAAGLLSACGGGGGGGSAIGEGSGGDASAGDAGDDPPVVAAAYTGPDGLSATPPVLSSSVRVGRTVFEYTYTVQATNGGTVAFQHVAGAVTSAAPTTVVTEASLAFGHLAPGATASDTFTIRQDRSAPVAAADLLITLTGSPAGPGPAEGVLLQGDPGSPAIDAFPTLDPPPVARTDLEGSYILDRVTIYVAHEATVGEVNAALVSVGAGIVSAEPGRDWLGLAVPRQDGSDAIELLAANVGAQPGILLAFPGIVPQATLAPDPPAGDYDLTHHLRDARFPAAWNAHVLAETCTPGEQRERVALIVMDRFNVPHDELYVEIDSQDGRQLPRIIYTGVGAVGAGDAGGRHGYDAMMTALARFDGVSLTGAMPFQQCIDLVALQIGYETTEDSLRALDRGLNALDSLGQKAIVNHSLGYAVQCPDCEGGIGATSALFRATQGFTAREILKRHEDTTLVVASAGNEADKPATRVYRAYGLAEFDSAMNVAARSDATASWITDATLWQPASDCAPTCYRSLVASETERAQFDRFLAQRPVTVGTPAGNVIIVGSTDGVTNIPSRFSNPQGDVFAVGERVPSLQGPIQGTSFAAPQVAGLAAYLWLLSPELRLQPVATTVQSIIDNRDLATDLIDAYRTILALEAGEGLTPRGSPVRHAILNVAGDQNPALGRFDEADLAAFVAALRPAGGDAEPTAADYGRFDLNGDGYTGGTRTAPFDLDPASSPRFGRAVLGNATTSAAGLAYDERAVTDAQILCYYAYSPLYAGTDPVARDAALAGICGPVSVEIQPQEATVAPGATVQFQATVRGTTNDAVTWSLPSGGGTLSASGLFTAGNASGTYLVRATSVADPGAFGNATVVIEEENQGPPGSYAGTVTQRAHTSSSSTSTNPDGFTRVITGDASEVVTWRILAEDGNLGNTTGTIDYLYQDTHTDTGATNSPPCNYTITTTGQIPISGMNSNAMGDLYFYGSGQVTRTRVYDCGESGTETTVENRYFTTQTYYMPGNTVPTQTWGATQLLSLTWDYHWTNPNHPDYTSSVTGRVDYIP